MKNARSTEVRTSALDQRQFYPSNPRQARALELLLQRPAKREELDARAGCSNSPELVAALRRRGLDVPCKVVQGLDRDGRRCRFGVYSLTDGDRQKLSAGMN